MAFRNNTFTNIWQKIQQDSVSWGSITLWIGGLLVVIITLTMFANILD
ncbi:hypothetical protein NIES2100_48980 [Calothrix sp. NIES-2100]|nr:hypothetical protein NIES2100_48980 [Calothrix sp. NIES-2100]